MRASAFSSTRPRRLLSAEAKLWLMAVSGLVPLALIALLWWRQPGLPLLPRGLLFGAALVWVLLAAFGVRRLFVHQLRTLSTLIEAIRGEEYSLRSVHAGHSSELAELFRQINALAQQLQSSRQDERELRGLLERIVAQMDLAVLACDSEDRVVLANPRAARLLALERERLQGMSLRDTEVAALLPVRDSEIREHRFAGAAGRWQISRQNLVQDGKPGSLIFIADLEQVLSEEEIRAWQRLIRVIAHEVNNSLTPITTLCQTLAGALPEQEGRGTNKLAEGLQLIRERALNLRAFISDYARIARLPEASKAEFDLLALIRKVAGMYPAHNLRVESALDRLPIYGDRTQLEQVLINLVKNAVEANGDASLPVDLHVCVRNGDCEILILDRGPGISNPANLFVPFYTTKEQGAGIGLALSRRIVSSHHGSLSLNNRQDSPGAELRLTLPLSAALAETGR